MDYVCIVNILPANWKKIKGAPKRDWRPQFGDLPGSPLFYIFPPNLFQVKRPQLSIKKGTHNFKLSGGVVPKHPVYQFTKVCIYKVRKSGVITSPNYPMNYPNDEACLWVLAGPDGEVMAFKFKEFNFDGRSGNLCLISRLSKLFSLDIATNGKYRNKDTFKLSKIS